MTTPEMHELFRVLGQQMGMQKVRGILPASIDILLNTSIVHCVRQIITSNVTTNFGNVVAIQKNKISVINALRTLYVEKETDINYETETHTEDGEEKTRLVVNNPVNVEAFYNFDIFSIIDCSVSYDEKEEGDESPYKYISTRLIEPNLIEETERDYLLRPTYKFPVATIVEVKENYPNPEEDESSEESEAEVGTGIVYNLYTNNNKPTRIKSSFIKYPRKVYYDEQGNNHVHCDLPVHLHHIVVEEAVKLYFQSVSLTSGDSNNESQQNNKNR